MPKISELKESRYLKKEDCPLNLTISHLENENVGLGDNEDIRWVMYFNETDKGLILNTTNGQIMAENFGSEEMNDWIGKKVDLYNDRNVTYAGKRVGGVRVKSTGENKPGDGDEIPF
jgi:hypothetical protein